MKRKWTYTGTTPKIGSYPATLTVYDNNMNSVATISTTIKVVDNVITNPIKLLGLGDSLWNGKPSLAELRALSNNQITLVGTKGVAPLQHEGYSGWTSGTFLTAMNNDNYQGTQYTVSVTGIITVPTVNKEYTINGYKFKVLSTNITSGTGTITLSRINLGSISLANGTLIAVDSVLVGDNNIPYTSATSVPMNPFWDGTRFNYAYYKVQTGVVPDAIQLYLGTNGILLDPTANAINIKRIVDYIRQDDATIPIFVVNTLYRGDQNGIGNQTSSDGFSAGSGVWKLEEDRKVFNLMVKVNELLKDYTNLHFVPIALTHDSEYNFKSPTPVTVNPRSTITEIQDSEATHPSGNEAGYLQMADAMFSTMAAYL
jgi:hypothetical protein